jgi:preprotein translocase subunit SecG
MEYILIFILGVFVSMTITIPIFMHFRNKGVFETSGGGKKDENDHDVSIVNAVSST